MVQAIGIIIALALRPTDEIIITGNLNTCSKGVHIGLHLGIDLLIEALPIMPYPKLEMRELGDFTNPPAATIAGLVLIDELVKGIILVITGE